jgi:hypothetical protein
MATEMGEYVVGAYLRLCEHCDVIDYNARPSVSGVDGMTEIDVIGMRFRDQTAFLCEVATHLEGLNYGSYAETVKRVLAKHDRQRAYAQSNLAAFANLRFMLWSPRVPIGALTKALDRDGLELVVNEKYAECVGCLRRLARKTTKDIGNPFFRSLQIMEHLRGSADS